MCHGLEMSGFKKRNSMTNKIDLYYFGDAGDFDKNNPFYLFKKKWAPEILFEIANANRYELSTIDITKKVEANPNDINNLLSDMTHIGMLSKKDDRYSVSFPVILQKDVPIIDSITTSIAKKLSKKILSHKEEIHNLASSITCVKKFGYERILYHLIGYDIFDGSAMFEFSKRGIFSTSKPQFDFRDYILFGYEDSKVVSSLSERLLCSCNRTGTVDVDFVSFGDCDGDRQDMFRFMKQVALKLNEVTPNPELNLSYINILEQRNRQLVQVCANVIKKVLSSDCSDSTLLDEEIDAAKLLMNLKYIELDESSKKVISVPVFLDSDGLVVDRISSYLIQIIETDVASEFSDLRSKMQKLSAIVHGVDEKEIANELWHQVFGKMNEYLAEAGLISNPKSRIGEGRYFQAVYVKNI